MRENLKVLRKNVVGGGDGVSYKTKDYVIKKLDITLHVYVILWDSPACKQSLTSAKKSNFRIKSRGQNQKSTLLLFHRKEEILQLKRLRMYMYQAKV